MDGVQPPSGTRDMLHCSYTMIPAPKQNSLTGSHSTAYFAGGCFWCVASDIEKVPGVGSVTSGYMGGSTTSPTYETYAKEGHREVVQVVYDSATLSYEALVHFFLKHIDPTDAEGSFYDRGRQYSPAVYVSNEEERGTATRCIEELAHSKRFERPIRVEVVPVSEFFPAEAYHQEYHTHKPDAYARYREASGRDTFLRAYWGEGAHEENVDVTKNAL
jgi:peptide methionine sulfoxide reductase msrA/msrB